LSAEALGRRSNISPKNRKELKNPGKIAIKPTIKIAAPYPIFWASSLTQGALTQIEMPIHTRERIRTILNFVLTLR
jgi:hypothetical protein